MKFRPAIFVKSVGVRSGMMVELPAEPAERLAELVEEIEDILAGRGVRGICRGSAVPAGPVGAPTQTDPLPGDQQSCLCKRLRLASLQALE